MTTETVSIHSWMILSNQMYLESFLIFKINEITNMSWSEIQYFSPSVKKIMFSKWKTESNISMYLGKQKSNGCHSLCSTGGYVSIGKWTEYFMQQVNFFNCTFYYQVFEEAVWDSFPYCSDLFHPIRCLWICIFLLRQVKCSNLKKITV